MDPRVARVCYVGKSSVGVYEPRRYVYRARTRKDDRYVHRKIRKILDEGLEPLLIPLECFPDDVSDDVLDEAEVHYIKFFRSLGHPITNVTDGGEGTSGFKHREETKKKIGAKNSIALLGHVPWNKGKRNSQQCKMCGNEFLLGLVGGKLFCSAACYHSHRVGKTLSDEHRKNLSAAAFRRYAKNRSDEA